MHCATTNGIPINDILPGRDHDNEYMMIDATIVRAHQHSAGAQKNTGASHRPIPRRIDDQDSRAGRRSRQSCRGDAQRGPRSRSHLRRTSDRSRRSRRFDRRQGLRRRPLHRRVQRSSDRPSHPIQIEPNNPARWDFALYRERNLIERFFNPLKNFRAIATLTTNSPRLSSPAFNSPTPLSSTEHSVVPRRPRHHPVESIGDAVPNVSAHRAVAPERLDEPVE